MSEIDRVAMAAKQRTTAEDKAKAFQISARNGLVSLLAASNDHLYVGQLRVALKYLSKVERLLPAVIGTSEQLRDVLSFRALSREGGVTAGQ